MDAINNLLSSATQQGLIEEGDFPLFKDVTRATLPKEEEEEISRLSSSKIEGLTQSIPTQVKAFQELEENSPTFVFWGDILYDVTFVNGEEVAAHPGGAPFNVAANLKRLLKPGEGNVLFLGAVGVDDEYGKGLIKCAQDVGLSRAGFFTLPNHETAWAKVDKVVEEDGTEADHDFKITLGAMSNLTKEQVLLFEDSFRTAKYCLLNTLPMLPGKPTEEASETAIELARRYNLNIFFDPNLRLPVWEQEFGEELADSKLREKVMEGLEVADVVRMNLEELLFVNESEEKADSMTEDQINQEIDKFVENYKEKKWKLLVITRGDKGNNYLLRKDDQIVRDHVKAAKVAKVVSTVGCGDAFNAALMLGLYRLNKEIEDIDEPELVDIMNFAKTVAGKVAEDEPAILSRGAAESLTTEMEKAGN